MPTYDYRCESCGHVFELSHGMTENPAPECPDCGGKCRRLISGGAALILKGNGFHATDHRGRGSAVCGLDMPCCGRSEPCDTPPCTR